MKQLDLFANRVDDLPLFSSSPMRAPSITVPEADHPQWQYDFTLDGQPHKMGVCNGYTWGDWTQVITPSGDCIEVKLIKPVG